MVFGFHQFRHRVSPNLSIHTLGPSFINVFRNEIDNVSDITLQRLANTRKDRRCDVISSCHLCNRRRRQTGHMTQIGLVHVLVDEQFPKLFV